MEQRTAKQEAIQYLDNAKETLKKAHKENVLFKDIKYVRTASGTAYLGALLAIDEYLKRKEGAKFKKPSSIEEYQYRVVKHNKKLNALLSHVYGQLHILGYYHGTDSVKIIKSGLESAEEIIEFL